MSGQSQLVKTIKGVMPAVVAVVVSKKLERVERQVGVGYPPAFGASHLKVPPDRVDAHGRVQVGGGSGFFVDKSGVVLTNRHVIEEPFAEYTIITGDHKRYKAEVAARDPIDDIAVLKVSGSSVGGDDFPAVSLGSSMDLDLGQTVIAFGNALGVFQNTVSSGIISGLCRAIDARTETSVSLQEMRGLIQIDAAINPGNSGGPLTDIDGRVIGINAAVIANAQNIGFAIPIDAARRDLDDMREFGHIRRALLGVRYLTVAPEVAGKLKLGRDYGAFITRESPLDTAVAVGGPADKAGLKEGDLILEWDGERITAEKTIHDFLAEDDAGDEVELKVLRGGREIKKKVKLGEKK